MTVRKLIALIAGSALLMAAIPAKEKQKKDTVVTFATEGNWKPYNYVDENGTLTGMDVEIVRALDERIPGYSFEFVTTAWDSMFVGLTARKYDAIADGLTYTDERAKVYLFSAQPYAYIPNVFVYRKGSAPIRSLSDLAGRTLLMQTGNTITFRVEEWNKAHGNKINIVLTENQQEFFWNELTTGRVDAFIGNPSEVQESINRGKPFAASPVPDSELKAEGLYIVIGKTKKGQALKPEIDRALAELRADGTLSRIVTRFFGADYSAPLQ